jgi:tRNA (guanosine-2'-O-)-methyltransferase
MDEEFEALSLKFGNHFMINYLSSFISPLRLNKIRRVCSDRMKDLMIATEGIYDIHNALAIIRTAEALGVDSVHFVDCDYKKGQGRQTARGTLDWIRVYEHEHLNSFVSQVKQEGWLIAGACIRAELNLNQLPIDSKICLLMGNEHRGLSSRALSLCDYTYKIPMYGMVESLNLSVAGALSLYDLGTRKRLIKDSELLRGKLEAEQSSDDSLLAWLIVRSLGIEKTKGLLQASGRSLFEATDSDDHKE